jgi:hypothetical protein
MVTKVGSGILAASNVVTALLCAASEKHDELVPGTKTAACAIKTLKFYDLDC